MCRCKSITVLLDLRMYIASTNHILPVKQSCSQNWFRPGRTTVAQILAPRRIMEEARKNNLSVVRTFIDFRKVFDSITRMKMKQVLKAYEIPPNLQNAIMAMYTNKRASVLTPDGETEELDIWTGVL